MANSIKESSITICAHCPWWYWNMKMELLSSASSSFTQYRIGIQQQFQLSDNRVECQSINHWDKWGNGDPAEEVCLNDTHQTHLSTQFYFFVSNSQPFDTCNQWDVYSCQKGWSFGSFTSVRYDQHFLRSDKRDAFDIDLKHCNQQLELDLKYWTNVIDWIKSSLSSYYHRLNCQKKCDTFNSNPRDI